MTLNQDMALKWLKNFINLVFIKNLWNFSVVLKPCLDLMMSFKNCIRIRIASFCQPAYYFLRLRRCQTSVSMPCALGGVDWTHGSWYCVILECGFLDSLFLNNFKPLRVLCQFLCSIVFIKIIKNENNGILQ